MMRFHAAITTGIATLLVVPLVALDDADLATLQDALGRTTRTLDVLSGIQEHAETEPDASSALILGVTEPAILDERGRDERLESLRAEVNLLQMELDAHRAGVLDIEQPRMVAAPSGGDAAGVIPIDPELTSGLDDTLRAALGGTPVPRPRPTAQDEPPAGDAEPPVEVPSPEHPGYSADPLSQARACYRAGRFEEGLRLLEPMDEDPTALYWKARCLENLDRLDEAIAILERVTQEAEEEYAGKRAQTDLEFLRWKREFLQKLPAGIQDQGGRE